jgi:hypothetical protein
MMQRRLDVTNEKTFGMDQDTFYEQGDDDYEDDMYDNLEEELTGEGALLSSVSGTGFSACRRCTNMKQCDIVEAVAKKTRRIDVMKKCMQPILSASKNKTARTKLHSLEGNTDDDKSTKAVTFSNDSVCNETDSCEQVISDSVNQLRIQTREEMDHPPALPR